MYVHYQQDRLAKELVYAFDSGDGTIEIGVEDWAVPGEDSDTLNGSPSQEQNFESEAPVPAEPKEKIKIFAIAKIIIPKIDLKMPIAEGATDASLRVAIGHYTPSVPFGENGQSVLLGHRMYTYGRFFNRLDELAVEDQVLIETQTERQIWQVIQVEVILPEELDAAFSRTYSEPYLLLVTCTPVKVADHRLLVTLKLNSREPLSADTAVTVASTAKTASP